ncbi:MAG: DUF4412 domain-containing protein [Cytophagales bacterium]
MLKRLIHKHIQRITGHVYVWPVLFLLIMAVSSCQKDDRFEGEINFDVVINNDESGKMKSLAPEKYHFKIKKNRIIFTTEGGLSSTLFGGMIFDGQKDEGYLLMKSSQLAYKMARGKDSKLAKKASEVTSEIKTTNEKDKILGYSVEKFIIKSTEEGKTTTNEVWVTKEINIDFPKSLVESTPDMFFGAFEGFPLKVITTSQSGREITLIASEIDETSISSSAFDIPDNYKVTEDDPSDMINMFRQFLK